MRSSVSVNTGGTDAGTVGGVTVGQRHTVRFHRLDRFANGHFIPTVGADGNIYGPNMANGLR